MLIFVDIRTPEAALKTLEKYGEVIRFETHGITYDAISCHPDIFLCQTPDNLIVAPNIPSKYLELLYKNKIKFTFGNSPVGLKYPESSHYNALITDDYVVHNKQQTDITVQKLSHDKKFINVNQSYSRCNTIFVNDFFITSDIGIYKALNDENLSVNYVNPAGIMLHGFKHGFFGGCCGVYKNKLFVCGSLNYLSEDEHQSIRNIDDINIIELYNGKLFDCGGIIII